MALIGGKKYRAKVLPGSCLVESSKKGTLGFEVMLETADDPSCSYMIWITEGTREKAVKTFTEALGVPLERLQDGNYIQSGQLSVDIEGRNVTAAAEEEEYNGNVRVKITAIYPPSNVAAGPMAANKFASFFGGADPIDDTGIPF